MATATATATATTNTVASIKTIFENWGKYQNLSFEDKTFEIKPQRSKDGSKYKITFADDSTRVVGADTAIAYIPKKIESSKDSKIQIKSAYETWDETIGIQYLIDDKVLAQKPVKSKDGSKYKVTFTDDSTEVILADHAVLAKIQDRMQNPAKANEKSAASNGNDKQPEKSASNGNGKKPEKSANNDNGKQPQEKSLGRKSSKDYESYWPILQAMAQLKNKGLKDEEIAERLSNDEKQFGKATITEELKLARWLISLDKDVKNSILQAWKNEAVSFAQLNNVAKAGLPRVDEKLSLTVATGKKSMSIDEIREYVRSKSA